MFWIKSKGRILIIDITQYNISTGESTRSDPTAKSLRASAKQAIWKLRALGFYGLMKSVLTSMGTTKAVHMSMSA